MWKRNAVIKKYNIGSKNNKSLDTEYINQLHFCCTGLSLNSSKKRAINEEGLNLVNELNILTSSKFKKNTTQLKI